MAYKGMILAAGKGTRVRPITYTIPKPMIPILERPVMEFLVDLLRRHGITQIMVNVSHLAHQIENYFRDGQRFGVQIAYSFEGRIVEGELIGEALGSAGGMKRIQEFHPFFDDTFVVLCGDALIDLDLTAAIRWHRQRQALATIITKSVPLEVVSNYGVVVTDAQYRVRSFQEKPRQEEALSTQINTGIYIFEPEIFEYIPSGQVYDLGSQLFPKLVELDVPFYALPMEFEWIDIGQVPDYWRTIQMVLQGQVPHVPIPGQQIRPGIYTGLNVAADWEKIHIQPPVYIGGMTRIEPGVTIIGPAMIGANCRLGQNVCVERSIIFEYSRLGDGVHLKDKLVFGRYCVDKSGATIDLQKAALDWLITDSRCEVPPGLVSATPTN
jgi:mannose-1-phosphate guanylyltransferase